MSRRKETERRRLWRQRIAQQKTSGLTVRAFCREHNLPEHSFYWWRRELGASAEPPIRFALVETATAANETQRFGQEQPQLELVLNSGERLRIPADAAILRLVLSVVRQAEPTR